MTSGRRLWLFVALLVLCSGCRPTGILEKFADDEKQAIAQAYIQRLIDGDLEKLAAELHPELRKGKEVAQLAEVRAYMPKENR